MSLEVLGRRLEQLAPKLSEKSFLENRGIGNEIGFYIFAYKAEYEPDVSGFLPRLQAQLKRTGVEVLIINLYELILELLMERDALDESFELEAKRGSARLEKALSKIVRPQRLIEQIELRLEAPHDLVFITGVGAAYPLVRSHTILNNLHPIIDEVPVVMFFPGSYDGQELQLFDTLKDDNYYRAFPLLPDTEFRA